MNTEVPNQNWTGPISENPLLDSPPPGFEVIRLGKGAVTIQHRRTGMGCMNAFIVVWLTAWTAFCVVLVDMYLGGEKMEDGTPMPLWFVGIFWITDIIAATWLLKFLFERRSFQFEGDTLTIERSLFGRIKTSVLSKTLLVEITQVQDGGVGEDSFPSWGLKVEDSKSHELIIRQPHPQSAWLGQLIADWADRRFDAVQK